MSEDTSRLDLLRFLERIQERDLARTRQWIIEEQQRLAEIAARQPPPPPPDWLVEQGIGVGRPIVAVHQGGCRMAGKRTAPIPRGEALRLLGEDTGRACQQCRPDTELGVL
ncbi:MULTISPECIES: DUF6233 domain-containing protein [Streptomyces]|uniref:DUF6233 domain-containing protein n=1 Tax=Streptomyces TaxID=1883 RepID=UPI0004C99F27|nr:MULTISPECIES: DUF6233 domain-containing protein [unclassified Streptomyces]AWL37137.1 hypothetical protein B9S64_02645 [Streptomyces sp. SM18]